MDKRHELQQLIEALPDERLPEVVNYVRAILAQEYADWTEEEWQTWSLSHFFAEDDEVTYTLDDARELYHETTNH